MSDAKGAQNAFDPFESLRGMRDAYLDGLAKAMVETVNSEGYAQATGAMLDSYLTASGPFREALERSMAQALQGLSLPSRQEVASLAERFTHFEMRLDDVEAKLDEIAKLLKQGGAAPKAATATAAKKPAGARRNPRPTKTARRGR